MGFEEAVICDITQFEKNPQKYISVDRRYFYCIFMTHMTSIYARKKVRQKYGLFMQNFIISWKKIDTSEDKTTQAKRF